MMDSQILIMLAVMLPFITAAVINLLGKLPVSRDIAQGVIALGLLGVVFVLISYFLRDMTAPADMFEMLPGIDISFRAEPLGLIYAGIAALMWPVAIIYSAGYLRLQKDEKQTRFFIFFSLSIGASMGIAFAGNLITMFVFYEMLTLVTYPLVVHSGTAEARQSGRIYLAYVLGSSLLMLLPAIAAVYSFSGKVDFSDGGMAYNPSVSHFAMGITFMLFIFGAAKAAIFPLHGWLPKAMVAPAPVSALLHAVAVVTAGVFVIGKSVIYVFGADNIEFAGHLKEAALYLAAATIIMAGILAIMSSSIKARLAYSTISNLAYMVLAFLLLSKAGAIAAAAHMVSHSAGKITLFFISGALMLIHGINQVADCNGMAKRSRLLFTCFLICSISIVGLPFFAGGFSKDLIIAAAAEEEIGWVIYVLYASMLMGVWYLLSISYRAFLKPDGGFAAKSITAPGRHYLMKGAILFTTGLTLSYPLYECFIIELMERILL